MSSQQYTLHVVNNSGRTWDMCLYQLHPDIGTFPVAWFVRSLHTGVMVRWPWSVDQWSFVWAETGVLAPGGQFDTAQEWPADPAIHEPAGPKKAGDCVGLMRDEDGYTFFSPSSEPTVPPGQVRIVNDRTVRGGQVAVGVANSGSPVVAVQGVPSMSANFTLQPHYFIAAGSFRQGEVLDLASIPNPAEIDFPPGIDYMNAVFGPDDRWHIEPVQQSLDSVHETRMVTP